MERRTNMKMYFNSRDYQERLINKAHDLGIKIGWMIGRKLIKKENGRFICLRVINEKTMYNIRKKVENRELKNKVWEIRLREVAEERLACELETETERVIYDTVKGKYGGGFALFFAKELYSLIKNPELRPKLSIYEIREKADLEMYGPGTPSSSEDESIPE